MLRMSPTAPTRDDLAGTLDELVADGARQMLLAALEAEVHHFASDVMREQRSMRP